MSELTGRELDAAVAREVMGWGSVTRCAVSLMTYGFPRHASEVVIVPVFSRDIAAAWQVLDEVRQDEDLLSEFTCALRGGLDAYEKEQTSGHSLDYFLLRDMTPEAICRAALAAVRVTTAPASPATP